MPTEHKLLTAFDALKAKLDELVTADVFREVAARVINAPLESKGRVLGLVSDRIVDRGQVTSKARYAMPVFVSFCVDKVRQSDRHAAVVQTIGYIEAKFDEYRDSAAAGGCLGNATWEPWYDVQGDNPFAAVGALCNVELQVDGPMVVVS